MADMMIDACHNPTSTRMDRGGKKAGKQSDWQERASCKAG
jgi:hypothetical protein